MLTNIFLFIGKNLQDLNQLNIYTYPQDIINFENTDQISKIIFGHDHGDLVLKSKTQPSPESPPNNPNTNPNLYYIDTPIPQIIDGLNIYTSCINGKIIIGLVFDKDDNPYDYKDIFRELLNELLNIEKACSFDDEIEIENFLITIFIDIRRFGDEQIALRPQIEFLYHQESFVKVFLLFWLYCNISAFLRIANSPYSPHCPVEQISQLFSNLLHNLDGFGTKLFG